MRADVIRGGFGLAAKNLGGFFCLGEEAEGCEKEEEEEELEEREFHWWREWR